MPSIDMLLGHRQLGFPMSVGSGQAFWSLKYESESGIAGLGGNLIYVVQVTELNTIVNTVINNSAHRELTS